MASNSLVAIQQTLRADDTINQLMLIGALPNTAEGKNEANRYVASVLGEIERSERTEHPISRCDVGTIRQVLIDSMRYKVPIDGRKMAHIDVRWNKNRNVNEAILQIDTNGFIAKIAEHYPDFHIKATPVFKGDDLEILEDGSVKHKQKNIFCTDVGQLEGMLVQCSYTKGGRLLQEAVPVNKQDLLSMKAVSRAKNIWDQWTMERMKTAAIKRICKWHFRTLQGVQDIVDYDNRLNYDMDKPVETKGKNIIDNINDIIDDKVQDIEVVEEGTSLEELKSKGDAAALLGVLALGEWANSLTPEQRASLKKYSSAWNKTAKEADAAKVSDDDQDDDLFVVA